MTKTTIGLINLGCPRNLVDSEVMQGLLKGSGFVLTEDFNKCEAAVINTCSFIEDAKKESIDLILRLIDLKKEGKLKSIIVAGCLPQRYAPELKKELKEIDGFLGTGDFIKVSEVVRRTLSGEKIFGEFKTPTFLYNHTYPRDLITPKHFIYLKLTEGCNNQCSYCIIPAVRGSLRSRRISSLLKEVQELSSRHRISEINLVGQDITVYGVDLYGRSKLAELLKRLAVIKKTKWLRLLYTHPAHYTDDLINVIKNEASVCKYLDLPLQHISDRILKRMNRQVGKKDVIRLIDKLRERIPGLALRTTFIVGFPGETEKEFKELVNFLKEIRFERLGIFEYSREEGTNAHDFKDQIPARVKKQRFDEVMKIQQGIAKEVNAEYLGKELEVLIDEIGQTAKADRLQTPPARHLPCLLGRANSKLQTYIGRTEYDAPEVDGNCFVRTMKQHKQGDFVRVRIIDTLEYDLVAEEI